MSKYNSRSHTSPQSSPAWTQLVKHSRDRYDYFSVRFRAVWRHVEASLEEGSSDALSLYPQLKVAARARSSKYFRHSADEVKSCLEAFRLSALGSTSTRESEPGEPFEEGDEVEERESSRRKRRKLSRRSSSPKAPMIHPSRSLTSSSLIKEVSEEGYDAAIDREDAKEKLTGIRDETLRLTMDWDQTAGSPGSSGLHDKSDETGLAAVRSYWKLSQSEME